MKLELMVPTSLMDIPLRAQQKFLKSSESSNDTEFIKQKMIECFCGIDLKEVVKIKFKDSEDLIADLNKLFEVPKKFYPTFEFGGVKFGFIPNLEEITWEEYIDLENYLGDWSTMHKAMAVMYRPIIKEKGKRYEIEPYQSAITYCDVMELAPVAYAIGASFFFYNLGKELSNHTAPYLIQEMKKMNSKISAR